MADGKVIISTKLDNSGFTNGIAGLKASLKGIAATIGVAFGVAAVVNFGKESVKVASEMKSAFTGLRSIVEGQGRSFKEAKAFVQDYISDGLVPATNAVTAYKNLAMRGYDDKQIQEVMIALKNSSAYGRSAALTMGEAVSSATEGLRNENSILVDNAGVTKNVSMMWKDYAKSIGVGVDSLTQQQKIQAEVTGMLHETRYQMGDAAKIAGDYAGQVLGLKFAVNDLKIALGNMVIPISQFVIPAFRSMITAVTKLLNVLGQVTGAIFGGTNKQLQQTANAASSAASAEDNLAAATQKAGKAAKNSISSFDELNVLQKDTGTDSGAGAVGGGAIVAPPVDMTESEGALSEAAQRILALLEPLRQISFDNLSASFERLKAAVAPLSKALFAGLKWAYDNVFVPFAKWAIEDAAPVFLDALAAGIDGFNKVLDIFKPIGIWLWDNFLQPLASWTGGAIIEVMEKIRDVFQQAADWYGENKEKLLGLFEAVSPLLKSIGDSLLKTFERIKDLFLKVWQAVIDVFMGILDFIVGVFTGDWEQAWEGIKGIFFGVIDALMAILTYFWEMLVDGFNTGWENIKLIWNIVAGWFNDAVIQPIAQFFTGLWDSIKAIAISCWEAVKSCWNAVAGWFDKMVVKPVAGFFTGLWDGIVKAFNAAWEGMSKGFKGYINGWLSLLEGFANFFVNMMNLIIEALNSISVDIPDWVPGFGGETFGIDIPNIPQIKLPRLAQGAVVPANREFMALLGDNKKETEIVSPLSTMRQAVMEAIQQSGHSGTGETRVVMNVDGRTLGEFVISYINGITEQTNVTPIMM